MDVESRFILYDHLWHIIYSVSNLIPVLYRYLSYYNFMTLLDSQEILLSGLIPPPHQPLHLFLLTCKSQSGISSVIFKPQDLYQKHQ